MFPIVRRLALAATAALFAFSSAEAFERRVYALPEGARPHDVAPAPDGTV